MGPRRKEARGRIGRGRASAGHMRLMAALVVAFAVIFQGGPPAGQVLLPKGASAAAVALAQERPDLHGNGEVGSVITFGRYEQDDDLSNGPEPIEWIVLNREGDRALLLTKDLIASYWYWSVYAEEKPIAFTWESSTLRKWLQDTFLSKAFTPAEQAAVPTVTVKAEKHPEYDFYAPGRDTQDKVFVLSYSEAFTYLPDASVRGAALSATVKNTLYSWQNPSNPGWYLRTPGGKHGPGLIRADGSFAPTWNGKNADTLAVRPACWVDLRAAGGAVQGAPPVWEDPALAKYRPGAMISFGHYEQDNDVSNGKEPIEWVVLVREGNRALVLSKHVLDAGKYGDGARAKWEGASVRKWLNGAFLAGAFTEAEQAVIALRTVRAERSGAGRHTQDRLFLLSRNEVKTHLPQSGQRVASPTVYALAQRAGYVDRNGNCWWWLRSSTGGPRFADVVNNNGGFGSRGVDFATPIGIRPACWLNLDGGMLP